jgi:hypothetical protein
LYIDTGSKKGLLDNSIIHAYFALVQGISY